MLNASISSFVLFSINLQKLYFCCTLFSGFENAFDGVGCKTVIPKEVGNLKYSFISLLQVFL